MTAPAETGARAAIPDLPALTGIRAIAAGMVLFLHLNQAIPNAGLGALPFIHYGYLGVDVFFVLSGFIISHVYGQELARFDGRRYGKYLWYRFARLYPVHVAVLLVLILMVFGMQAAGITPNTPANWDFTALIWQFTLTHAWGFTPEATWNGPAWSISLEFLAYLLFPVFLLMMRPFRRPLIALAGVAALCAILAGLFLVFEWRIKAALGGGPGIARVLVEFGVGCLLYAAWRNTARSRWWDLAAVLSLAAFVAAAWFRISDLALVPVLALGVFAVALSSGLAHRLLASRAMVWLGEISYAVYMVHFAVILVLLRLLGWTGLDQAGMGPSLLILAGTVALVIFIAALAHYAVERPARKLLRNIPRRRQGQAQEKPSTAI